MSVQKADLAPLKRAVAVLTTCIVQTLNESDPTFRERFVKRLERAYRELQTEDRRGHDQDMFEALAWTREFVTGFSHASGQGRPFLED
jgi:hypothetical protein